MSQTVAIVLPLPVALALVVLLLVLLALSAVALSLRGQAALHLPPGEDSQSQGLDDADGLQGAQAR